MKSRTLFFATFASLICLPSIQSSAEDEEKNGVQSIGVAKVDITPTHPVRLSGYGNRREEFEEVAQPIWAKALAFGAAENGEDAAVLITVDNCGIPASMRTELAERLQKKAGLKADRLAICFSHTHTAPCLKGALVNIFSSNVPPEHQSNIDRYSRQLLEQLEEVALAALANRSPAKLSMAVGSAGFARNRRVLWGGPVDHSLPVIFVHRPEGELRAVFANYACHATTLNYNKVHGDWPGTAMVGIERDHPGVVALIGIGCGADMNPIPRGSEEFTEQHGEEIAAEVSRLLQTECRSLRGPLSSQVKDIALPLAAPPSREELKLLAASKRQNIAYAAKQNLARLDRGEKLAKEVPYQVQAWTFGKDLAMVFLPGEVTIDYQLRLKTEFDGARMWVNAYSNDAPCYIPSRKVLAEGGYEGESAMVYYDQPARFAPGAEDRVIAAVHQVLPEEFLADYRADLPPKSPADSLAAIKTRDDLGLVVELAAAEPFVADPVAIDWDARGRMWVVEQPDYPNGMDGNWKPGGRVKILSDNDGDGRYEKSELLLEGIPFPTGITCWGKGAYVCAAPDILYVEDTTGDGKADRVDKLFTGFHTDNYNARINSLALGLDSWIHGANGLLGGKIRNEKTGIAVDIRGRDLRFRPETMEFDLVSGVTQQGRVRDDWDNWFGCSNSRWIFHFPLPEQEVRRNPHVTAPGPSFYLPEKSEAQLHAISQPLERFNNPDSQGHITSACGLGIYRDVLLGDDFAGNAFIGETAHNLVRRYQLNAKGATFAVRRPKGEEEEQEFFASADNWSRPVQIRTGPDGALYIVDMYRAVIEHTRWIPADRLANIDPRAGEGMGRIYRLVPSGTKLRKVSDLSQLDPAALVAALDTPNGTTRDLVHQQLLLQQKQNHDRAGVRAKLAKLAVDSEWPAVRVHALAVLDGLQLLSPAELIAALADSDARVRRHALRLVAPRIADNPELADAGLQLLDDADFTVRYQLAQTLGDWDDSRAAEALVQLAATDNAIGDKWFRGALLSSSVHRPLEILESLLAEPGANAGRTSAISALISTAAATANEANDFENLIQVLAPKSDARPPVWQLDGVVQVLDALDRRDLVLTSVTGAEQLRPLFAEAHRIAADDKVNEAERQAALRLFGRGFNDPAEDVPLLAEFLRPTVSDAMQKTALTLLARSSSPKSAEAMLSDWSLRAPSMRASIIATLLARDPWIERLLKAVEDGVVSPAEVTASHRQILEAHKDEGVRKRSSELLPVADNSERAAVVAKYQSVADLKGDAVQGATVFKNACAVCHDYLGQGKVVGPNLKAYYNKSASDFVTAILNPNAAVEPRYVSYAITTRDKRTLVGVITNESAASLEVVQPGGIRETILRPDIESIDATGLSLMPDGLEQAITPQAMADLIAYLKSGG